MELDLPESFSFFSISFDVYSTEKYLHSKRCECTKIISSEIEGLAKKSDQALRVNIM